MSNSNAKGDRRERELVNALDEAGFAVMRAPASGSATERELPDALAGDGERFFAIEAKSSAGPPIYLDGAEIEALLYFAQNFGAKPRVAARFDREDWYFFHPGDLHVTDGGNYRVKKEEALSAGTDFAEFAGVSERTTLSQSARQGSRVAAGLAEHAEDATDGSEDDEGPSQSTLDVLGAFERGDLSLEETAEMLD